MQEQRAHPRLESRDSVVITVLSAPDAPSLEHHQFFCSAKDLSVAGIRFCVHTEVPVGALLELRVDLAAPPDVFRHVGRVIWTQDVEEDLVLSHLIGVAIDKPLGGRTGNWADMLRKKPAAAL